jgi:putative ABC transport system permease protein
MNSIFQDVRYGLRMLGRSPGYSAVAILSLALGIGANTTIFSFVNAFLFRVPAVEEPGSLAEIWLKDARRSWPQNSQPMSMPEFEYYRDHNQVFFGIAANSGETSPVIWNRAGDGEILQRVWVTANYFSLLGIKLPLGRAFLPEDDAAGAEPAVVLSHAVWQGKFAADPQIIGNTVTLNGRSFTVIGVAPSSFNGMMAAFAPDVYMPMGVLREEQSGELMMSRHTHWLIVDGRLKRGQSRAQAVADLEVLTRHLRAEDPESNRSLVPAVYSVGATPGPLRGFVGGIGGALMAVVGLVLLIACANAASVLLARAAAREREMAVRAALGAGKGRIVRQVLTESILVACLAGVGGVFIALWAAPALLALKPPSAAIALDVSMDWRVLAFTMGLAVLTGIIFGTAPALHTARLDLRSALSDASQGGGRTRQRLRSILVVGQVAACAMLLVGAGLCLRSLINARSIDPGFDTRNVLSASLDPGLVGYSEERGEAFYRNLVSRAAALPGVESASLADYLPLGQRTRVEAVTIPGYTPPPAPSGIPGLGIQTSFIYPDYFRSMGIPLLKGRDFTGLDKQGAPRVVVINDAMARRFWPQGNAIGQRIGIGGPEQRPEQLEIVGIVKTGKYRTLGEDPQPFIYKPFLQNYSSSAELILRTRGGTEGVLSALRGELRGIDPKMALVSVETMQQHMEFPLFPAQAAGLLLGAFGTLAMALAILGVYGIVAFSVSQRTREIGLRLALGATRWEILKMVLTQGIKLTLIGLAVGLAGAAAGARVLSSLLYGIQATDAITFVSVAILFVAVALAATLIPARRAASVDPMTALRYE